MEFVGYLAVIFIGIVLGSIGAGASMLAIPVLVYLFALDMQTASAYSLFVVGVTSLAGTVLKQKDQLVSARAVVLFGIPSVAGAFVARKWVIIMIPDVVRLAGKYEVSKNILLLTFFSLLMVISSLTILFRKPQGEQSTKETASLKLTAAGFIIGLLSGTVGAGGGFLVLPALIFFAGLSFAVAVGTTLLIIAANSLLGFCGDLFNQSIHWRFLLTVTALAVLGLFLGSRVSKTRTRQSSWQRAFAWFSLGIGVFTLLKELLP